MVHALMTSKPPLVPVGGHDDIVQESQALRLKFELLLDVNSMLQDHLELRRQKLCFAFLELHLPEWLNHLDLLRQGVLESELRMDEFEESWKCLVSDIDIDRDRYFAGCRLSRDQILQNADGSDGVRLESGRALRIPADQKTPHKGAPVSDGHFVICRPRWELVDAQEQPLVHVHHSERPRESQFAHWHIRWHLCDFLMQREWLYSQGHQVCSLWICLRHNKTRDRPAQAFDGAEPDLEAAPRFLHAVCGQQGVHRVALGARQDCWRAIMV
mmetsp:Transcript_123736/g.309286  ORF Transcript_123736/g.309286 Transcript_123736/m.309286 type:complete len:271 (-) Transcript_123736:1558-2370(-)